MPTPPSTSLHPSGTAAKGKNESQLAVIEPPKRTRREARDSETNSATSSSILPLRDELTHSPSASTASQSERRRSISPARHKRLLEYATPRVRYLNEWDNPEDSAAQSLRDFLPERPYYWEPKPDKIQEVLIGSRKCVTQQRSETSWPNGIDWVVGFPKERWESLYASAAAKFRSAFINHVDHPHTGTQVLGCGCEIKPPDGDLVEAQVQLGVWAAGFYSWAFQNPPPMVGFIPIGQCWDFYIIYAVQEETDGGQLPKLGEVRVWGPLSELAGRTSNEGTCYSLVKSLRRVMDESNEIPTP
ncbi:uncharacterized protein KD926_005973 [Aspergillus affinis]|uniref:uncharacterized protein n=1 Tax=Aspergillus affinis TaxID=1070780 RepID=UPI0022FEE003|nr:uncharacterized protein KD926_005973 [Aspergillus affinis]KAI9046026.1 hypothetical protein KD926_005973 [Aspergillus affinis]